MNDFAEALYTAASLIGHAVKGRYWTSSQQAALRAMIG
jgi:hypothetical protein